MSDNDYIDLFEAMGLENGKDWKFWKRPSNGNVEIVISQYTGRKVITFIAGHPSVREAVMAHRVPA